MKTLKTLFALLIVAAFTTSLMAQNPGLIKNILPTSDSTCKNIYAPVAYSNILYFSLQSTDYLGNFYRSDGTDAGTYEVKNIPQYVLGISNNTIFFTGIDANGYQLWKSDGTTSGTSMVKKLHTTKVWYNMDYTYCNNYTYFYSFQQTSLKDMAYELWKTDGTSSGTTMIKSYPTGCQYLTDLNGTMIFLANDGNGKSKHGHELWKSNGTSAGTVLVKDIYPGPTNCREPNSQLSGSLASQSATILYGLLKDGNYIYFAANDYTNGLELWRTDGTTNGTIRLTNINSASQGDSYCYGITKMGDHLYFAASDGSSGMELWRYSISGGATNIVKDLNSGIGNSDPVFLTVVPTADGDRLFFVANDGANGFELWKSDGSESGTAMVKDINPSGGSNINGRYSSTQYSFENLEWLNEAKLLVIGNKIYFKAYTATNGMELWESDGTEAGTVIVKDIYPGTGGSLPRFMTNVGGNVFFLAFHPGYGWEWWKYDLNLPINAPMDVETLQSDNYKIDFYPNPASESLTISGEFKNNVNLEIKIFDLLGNQKIGTEKSSVSRISEQIDISTFPAGMYIINFRFNGQSVQQKFIKK